MVQPRHDHSHVYALVAIAYFLLLPLCPPFRQRAVFLRSSYLRIEDSQSGGPSILDQTRSSRTDRSNRFRSILLEMAVHVNATRQLNDLVVLGTAR